MKNITLFLFFATIILFLPITGCSDNNNDAEMALVEYINPSENNPVNTLGWLKEKKETVKKEVDVRYATNGGSAKNLGGFIEQLAYKGEDYYEIRYGEFITGSSSKLKDSMFDFNSNVYDSLGNLCVSIIGGDAIATQPGYESFSDFWQVATFKTLLWEYTIKEQ